VLSNASGPRRPCDEPSKVRGMARILHPVKRLRQFRRRTEPLSSPRGPLAIGGKSQISLDRVPRIGLPDEYQGKGSAGASDSQDSVKRQWIGDPGLDARRARFAGADPRAAVSASDR
jgi:hypothetical protein